MLRGCSRVGECLDGRGGRLDDWVVIVAVCRGLHHVVHCESEGLKGEKVELLLQAHKSILSEDWFLSRICISSLPIPMSHMKLAGGKKK